MWIMPDGGVAMVNDPTVVSLGNVRTYARLTCEYSGGNRPQVRYVLKVDDDGVARCGHVDLDGYDVRTKHGRDVRPHLSIAAAYSQVVVTPDSIRVGSSPEKRAQAEQAAARRRNRGHRPETIAKVCVDHGRVWGRTAAVAKAFHVSKRQAARYIQSLKDTGLIPTEEKP
jgi:hypothetical protein